MHIVRDYQFANEADIGAAVAIGNFDGVHLGHQAVLNVVRQKAIELGSKGILLASGIVKADNPYETTKELLEGLD